MWRCALMLVVSGLWSGWAAEPAADEVRTFHIMANGIYAQEAEDGEWYVRLAGEIPSLCGAYLLVLDQKGQAVYHGVIPHGRYPADQPYRIRIPADGITGDYLIKIIGHQRDSLGLAVPMTELPREAYGDHSFAVDHELKDVPVWFKLPKGQTELTLAGYKAHLSVLDADGNVMGDTREDGAYAGDKPGTPHRFCYVMTLQLQPETPYQIMRECFYFRADGPLYLTFDPDRWFVPDPKLDELKWWEAVQ